MIELISVIVLAAGLSRRMGKANKLLLPLGEKTIVETTLSSIIAAKLGETLVIVGHEAEAVACQISDFRCQISNFQGQILTNPRYETGMTTSIQTGVEAANADSLGYMICLSDMPFITPDEYGYLKNEFLTHLATDKQAIVQPVFKEKRGNPTIFSAFYKKDIVNLTYTEGCKPIVQNNKNHVYLVEMPTDTVLRDIDVKEEYDSYLEH
jgi:molybdenum cofactor cytidylyltransferase